MTERMQQKWLRKVETITKAVEIHALVLTTWEEGFLPSIKRQLDAGNELTIQQSICLNRIYDRVQ